MDDGENYTALNSICKDSKYFNSLLNSYSTG